MTKNTYLETLNTTQPKQALSFETTLAQAPLQSYRTTPKVVCATIVEASNTIWISPHRKTTPRIKAFETASVFVLVDVEEDAVVEEMKFVTGDVSTWMNEASLRLAPPHPWKARLLEREKQDTMDIVSTNIKRGS